VTRTLDWEGCSNVRDLGGVPLPDGAETRSGSLFRADSIRKLTPAGLQSFAAHGITRVVDLRWQEELDEDPDCDLGVEVVHISLLGALVRDYDDGAARYRPTLDAVGYRAAMYSRWLDEHRERIVEALAAIADADGPVVFHCTGGKDRTGVVAALLLRLAGVTIDQAADDYALTDANLLRGDEDPEARFQQTAPAEAMERVLQHVESRFGGIEAYLRDGGLSGERIARLRNRLAAA